MERVRGPFIVETHNFVFFFFFFNINIKFLFLFIFNKILINNIYSLSDKKNYYIMYEVSNLHIENINIEFLFIFICKLILINKIYS